MIGYNPSYMGQRGVAVSSILLLVVIVSLMLSVVIRPNILSMKQLQGISRENAAEDSLMVLAKNIVSKSTYIANAKNPDQFFLQPPPMESLGGAVLGKIELGVSLGYLNTSLVNSVSGLDRKNIGYCAFTYAASNIDASNNVIPDGVIPVSSRGPTAAQFILYFAESSQNLPEKCSELNPSAQQYAGNNVKVLKISVDQAMSMFRSSTAEQGRLPGECQPGETLALEMVAGNMTYTCKATIASMSLSDESNQGCTESNAPLTLADGGKTGLECAPVQLRNMQALVVRQNQDGTVSSLYYAEEYLGPDMNAASFETDRAPTVPANAGACAPPSLNSSDDTYVGGGALVLLPNGGYTCADVSEIGLKRKVNDASAPLCPDDKRLVWLPGEKVGLSFVCEGSKPSDQNWGKITACEKDSAYGMQGYSPEANKFICLDDLPPATGNNSVFKYLTANSSSGCADGLMVGTDGGTKIKCFDFISAFGSIFNYDTLRLWVSLYVQSQSNYFTQPLPIPNEIQWAMNWNPVQQKIIATYPSNLYPDNGEIDDTTTCNPYRNSNQYIVMEYDPATNQYNYKNPGQTATGKEVTSGETSESVKASGLETSYEGPNCDGYMNDPLVVSCRNSYRSLMTTSYPLYLTNMRACTRNPTYIEPAQEILNACENTYGSLKFTNPQGYVTQMKYCTGNEAFTFPDQNFFTTCINDFNAGRYSYSYLSYQGTITACVGIAKGTIPAVPDPMLDPNAPVVNEPQLPTGVTSAPVDNAVDPNIVPPNADSQGTQQPN